jgi:hypothetical protein
MRSHPTEQQAREYLSRLTALARSGDFETLCQHGTLNCQHNLAALNAAISVPSTAPLVVGSRDVADGAQTQGGRVLEVCGLDGAGQAYRNEILFFGTADDFTAIEALYWAIGFSESSIAGSSPTFGPEWGVCPSAIPG